MIDDFLMVSCEKRERKSHPRARVSKKAENSRCLMRGEVEMPGL